MLETAACLQFLPFAGMSVFTSLLSKLLYFRLWHTMTSLLSMVNQHSAVISVFVYFK